MKVQSGILAATLPSVARYVFFDISNPKKVRQVLDELISMVNDNETVIGFGLALTQELGIKTEHLQTFPALTNQGINIPSTQHSLWLWLRGEDRGELLHRTIKFTQVLSAAFDVANITDAFRYQDGHDLSGYEDGTENPVGNDALEVIASTEKPYGTYVAVQHWEHNLVKLKKIPQSDQDNIIGRRLDTNEEIEEAPDSAHVKRTAMESFSPEAFVVRRSMPYIDADKAGLVFVAFANSFYAFDAQLKNMVGLSDGIVDGLFKFSKPVTGGYYWCPPVKDGKLVF